MGMHTWFYSDKTLYKEFLSLYERDLDDEANALYEEFQTEYHDVFRSSKTEPDGNSCTDVLTSLEETLEWIEKPDSLVYFEFVETTPEETKEKAIEKLREFWEKYPNGVIEFG